jgi:hypothetical protein
MINDGLNISLSFYYTEQNALDGQFAIINPATYVNEVPFDQPLWVVATNTLTGCKSNPKEIHLVITPAPELPVLPDLALCDQDNNGITAFNLTQQNSVIEIFMGAAPGNREHTLLQQLCKCRSRNNGDN